MSKRLFVGNLSYSVTKGQLEELFVQAGTIATCDLIIDKFSGQSKGFAFVEMATDEESLAVIKKFNDYELDGRKIVVNEARPREEKPRFNQNRGNYSRSGNRW